MKGLRMIGKGGRQVFLIWLMVSFLGTTLFVPGRAWALTLSDEKKIGREMLEMIKARMSLVEDGEVLTYVQAIGNRIVKQLGNTPYHYRFLSSTRLFPMLLPCPEAISSSIAA